MNAYCKYHGIGLIPWAPIAGGLLARPIGQAGTPRSKFMKGIGMAELPSESDKAIISRVQEIAEKRAKSMAQVSSAWVNAKVTSPILGLASEKRVEEAVEINELTLTEEEMEYLEEL